MGTLGSRETWELKSAQLTGHVDHQNRNQKVLEEWVDGSGRTEGLENEGAFTGDADGVQHVESIVSIFTKEKKEKRGGIRLASKCQFLDSITPCASWHPGLPAQRCKVAGITGGRNKKKGRKKK